MACSYNPERSEMNPSLLDRAARRRDRALRGHGRALARARARGRGPARGAHGDRRARLHRARAGGRSRRARAARGPHRLHRHARPAGAAGGDCRAITKSSSPGRSQPAQDRRHRGRLRRAAAVAALYVDAGDEVLVPDPGYPGYRHFVRAFEGVARPIRVSAQEHFQPTLEQVRAAWGPRTKGLLLGSPSNPTGTLISSAELEEHRRVHRRARRRADRRRDLPGPGLRRSAVRARSACRATWW